MADEPLPLGTIPPETQQRAADARAAGRSVPAHVPDCALLECDGLDARPDPDAPWMITMIPRRPAWVWDTLTVEPSPPMG